MGEIKSYLRFLKENKTRIIIILIAISLLHTIHFLVVRDNYTVEKTVYLKNGNNSISSGLAGLIGMGGLGGSSVNVEEINQYILSYGVFDQFRLNCYEGNNFDIYELLSQQNSYKNIYLNSIETRPDKLTNSIHMSVSKNDSTYVVLLEEFITRVTREHFQSDEKNNEGRILNSMDTKVDSLKRLLDEDITHYAMIQDRSRDIYLNSNKVDEIILLKNIELNKILLENYLRLTETTRAELQSNMFRLKEVYHTPKLGMKNKKSILLYGASCCMFLVFYTILDWARRYI